MNHCSLDLYLSRPVPSRSLLLAHQYLHLPEAQGPRHHWIPPGQLPYHFLGHKVPQARRLAVQLGSAQNFHRGHLPRSPVAQGFLTRHPRRCTQAQEQRELAAAQAAFSRPAKSHEIRRMRNSESRAHVHLHRCDRYIHRDCGIGSSVGNSTSAGDRQLPVYLCGLPP